MSCSSPHFRKKRGRTTASDREESARPSRRRGEVSPYFDRSRTGHGCRTTTWRSDTRIDQPTLHREMLFVGQAASRTGVDVLGGIAERRLARMAHVSVSELWAQFGRVNLLNYFPGGRGRDAKHLPPRLGGSYRLHEGEGDVFPAAEAMGAASALCDDLAAAPGRAPRLIVLLGLQVAKAVAKARVPDGVMLEAPRPALMARGRLLLCAYTPRQRGSRSVCWRCHARAALPLRGAAAARAPGPPPRRASSAAARGKADSPGVPTAAAPACQTVELLVLPHPSGVSHFWNGTANAEAASDVLRKCMAEYATTECGVRGRTV